MRHDARHIGVDHQNRAGTDIFEDGPYRRALAATRIGDGLCSCLDSSLGSLLVGSHDPRAADRNAGGQHVAEHRLGQRSADATRRMQARLALRARKRDHDGGHKETLVP